jgi:hypothetical protein
MADDLAEVSVANSSSSSNSTGLTNMLHYDNHDPRYAAVG